MELPGWQLPLEIKVYLILAECLKNGESSGWGQEDPESCQLFSEETIRGPILAGKDPAFSPTHTLVPAWYTPAPGDPSATPDHWSAKHSPKCREGWGRGGFLQPP